MSVQDSESRHLEHLAERFSGRSWVKISPGSIFFGVFERFQTFFPKIFANSEQYRNLLAGIFDILTLWKHRVPIVTGLRPILAPHLPRNTVPRYFFRFFFKFGT